MPPDTPDGISFAGSYDVCSPARPLGPRSCPLLFHTLLDHIQQWLTLVNVRLGLRQQPEMGERSIFSFQNHNVISSLQLMIV